MSLSQYLPSFLAPAPPPSFLSQVYTTLISNPITFTTTTVSSIMSSILPLPFLSLLLFPLFTSYSTTLNVLFFYLMWSTLVLSHSPLNLEIASTAIVRLLFFLLPSTLFLAFDTIFPKAAISLKAQEEKALPFPFVGHKTLSRKLGIRSAPRQLEWYRIYAWVFLNLFISIALQGGIDYIFTKVLRMRSALKITTTLPLPWAVFTDLLRGFLTREVLSYLVHRYFLHSDSSPLSASHNSWCHALPAPYALTAHYDHPLVYLLRSFMPTYGPALFFRFHLLTYLLYLTLVSLEETFAYSGYSTVPTNFILGGIARRTDTHFLSSGKGNYAPLGIMDWAFGTSVGDDVADDAEREMERQDLNGKIDGAVEGARKKGRQAGSRARRRVRNED